MDELVSGFDYDVSKRIGFCEPCVNGKHRRSPFSVNSTSRSKKPLELIHSDVCRKISEKSLSGAEYFVMFVDDCTRYVWVYILKHKSEVFAKFIEWETLVEKSFDQTVKVVRSNNGCEHTSDEFESYLKQNGIKHQLTVPKSPEQNGVVKRLNRTLVEMVRSMLAEAKLPTKTLENKTPFEAWTAEKPRMDHLRVFGLVAYSHIPKDKRMKLDSKVKKCIFLGYCENGKGYRLYVKGLS